MSDSPNGVFRFDLVIVGWPAVAMDPPQTVTARLATAEDGHWRLTLDDERGDQVSGGAALGDALAARLMSDRAAEALPRPS